MSGANPTIFATGGAGYVGSHTVAALLENGYSVIVGDNYSNVDRENDDKPRCLSTLEKLTGKSIIFYDIDLRNKDSISKVFFQHKIDCVIHFAAMKAVGESVLKPLEYYKNNVGGSLNLLEVMKEHGVKKMVFSSSSMVYGIPQYLPLDEKHPTGMACTNPYGKSKYFIEEVLRDLSLAEEGWGIVTLRYFNPVGSHKSGLIGENPRGIPNNLMPYIAQVAVSKLPELSVFGSDYATPDGTGVRDYVHVMDVAEGHLAALKSILGGSIGGYKVYNLGTGKGQTVLELIDAFEKASGKKIPYKLADRRPGDVATLQADVKLAEVEMGWKATRDLAEMCEDTWRWMVLSNNIQ